MREFTDEEADKFLKKFLDPKNWCGACKETETPLERDESFCVTCGAANPNLDLRVVKRQGDATVEAQRARRCPSWHNPSATEFVDDGVTEIDWTRENPFCPFCGVKITVDDQQVQS